MNIWILQTGEPLHCDGADVRPMRAMNLANKLIENGHNVIIWSSAFSHQSKSHRFKIYKKIKISDNLEIRLIPSPGYKRNISFARFYDHFILGWNLYKQLKLEKKYPDVAFLGYPPIEVAYSMSTWLRKKKIPYLLDVKDKWPHIIVKSFPNFLRPIARILLSPYYFMAKKTMKYAKGISAHVPGFIDWVLNFSKIKNSDNNKFFPLTAPKDEIEDAILNNAIKWWHDKGVFKNDTLKLIFIGSFSRAFDFQKIFSVSEKLSSLKCEFIICGNGDRDRELRSKAKKCKNVQIIGWIDRPKIIALSQIADAAIAPYINTDDFIVSIPNKIIDSLMLGLPIFSSLEGEVESLIKNYDVGYSYASEDQLIKSIEDYFQKDIFFRNQLSENAHSLYLSKFEFNEVYNELCSHLKKIVEQ